MRNMAYLSFNSEEADQEVLIYHSDDARHRWFSDDAGAFLTIKNWGGSGDYITPSFGQYGQYVYAGGKVFGISYNQIVVFRVCRSARIMGKCGAEMWEWAMSRSNP